LAVGYVVVTKLMARDPGRALRLVGLTTAVSGLFLLGFALAPNVWVAFSFQFINGMVSSTILPGIYAIISLAVPPRMRTLGFATGSIWFLPGVAILPIVGSIGDHYGIRVAMAAFVPVFVIGALIMGSAGSFLNGDIEKVRVASLARAEARLARAKGQAKLLLVRHLDAGYDGVQVLFDVDFEVADGELIALLGTNGSGKSTLLKAVSGILVPTAGAVLFDGNDITSADPRRIVQLGVSHMPGGRGIFPTLSVEENLKVAAWLYRKDRDYLNEATEHVLGYFPILRDRWETPAGSLSGGEQQMLSLAQAFLSRPRLLMIDELSLGLAPTVVERLLEIVREIHANGSTVILVEQSVNIALRLAERATFLEKGEVRFSGRTSELLEKDDVLRAVYLHGTAKGLGDGADAEGADTRTPAQTKRRLAALAQAPVVLSCRGLTKRYGGVTAVDGVDLDLHQGEVVGLMGPNGAGKTTLFDLLSGHTPSNGGRTEMLGEDITALPAHMRARRGLGRSFQDARLFPGLTVRETIAVAVADRVNAPGALHAVFGLADVKDAELAMDEQVEEVIELLNLGPFRDKFTSELSTGSRRLVELALMVAERPQVLLLDEPSAGIAQREAEALGPVLRQVQRHLGCSILIIEHDMPLMRNLADRLVAMDTGRVVVDGDPETVLSDPRVVASYLGSATLDEVTHAEDGPKKATRRRAPRTAPFEPEPTATNGAVTPPRRNGTRAAGTTARTTTRRTSANGTGRSANGTGRATNGTGRAANGTGRSATGSGRGSASPGPARRGTGANRTPRSG
ncbi:MAG TPA: MFS transporter, partial [Acidimicrobiales bacterium]|nr:MFS transporter [Acidimicrobiales bacterium]